MEFYIIYDMMTGAFSLSIDRPPAGTLHYVCVQSSEDDDVAMLYDKNDELVQEINGVVPA